MFTCNSGKVYNVSYPYYRQIMKEGHNDKIIFLSGPYSAGSED